MRKRITIALLFIVGLFAVGALQVEAQEAQLDNGFYSFGDTALDEWQATFISNTPIQALTTGLFSFNNIPSGAEYMTFYLPDIGRNFGNPVFNAVTYPSRIRFYDSSNNLVDFKEFLDPQAGLGAKTSGWYQIDLLNDVAPTATQYSIELFVDVTGQSPISTLEADIFRAEAKVMFSSQTYETRFFINGFVYDRIQHGGVFFAPIQPAPISPYQRFVGWEDEAGNLYEFGKLDTTTTELYARFETGFNPPAYAPFDNWTQFNFTVPTTASLVVSPIMTQFAERYSFYIPNLGFNTYRIGNNISGIQINTTAGNPNPFIPFSDLSENPELKGYYAFVLSDYIDTSTFISFQVRVYKNANFISDPTGYLNEWNDNTFIRYNVGFLTARFFLGSTENWENEKFLSFVEGPQNLAHPSSPSLVFSHWETANGAQIVLPRQFDRNIDLFARYTLRADLQVPITPENPQNVQGLSFIITQLGWDNPAGYILFVMLILVPLNLFVAYIGMTSIPILIINGGIIGLFIFLEFVPFWFSFLFIGVIILAMILASKGVVNIE